MPKENWKPIKGYKGYYEVSDLGRVRSLDRRVPDKRNGSKFCKGRIIRPGAKQDYLPYSLINLCRNGVSTVTYAHTLVLEAFVGPRPEGMQACHYDGDAANNRLTNLRWDTQQANQQDSIRHGTHAGRNYKRLTDQQKSEILHRKANGERSLLIADAVGCTRSTVDRTWRLSTVC